MKREWWLDITEKFTELPDDVGSGTAHSKQWLEDLELSPKGFIHVVSASYCESLEREIAAIRDAFRQFAIGNRNEAMLRENEANAIRFERESGGL